MKKSGMRDEQQSERCKKTLSEHQCQGVVPGTFIACGEGAFQYCSEACLTIAKQANQLACKGRDAEEEEELHLDSMNLELPEEGGKVIPIIIGEPLQFQSREDEK